MTDYRKRPTNHARISHLKGLLKITVRKFLLTTLNNHPSKHVFRKHGLTYVDGIPTHTTVPELQTLFSIASSLPSDSNVIEIGSYLGASSCYIAAGLSLSHGRLYCVDTWHNETMPDGVKDTYEIFNKNTTVFSYIITPIRMRSDEVRVADLPPSPMFTFIDGDHSFEAVKCDFDLVSAITPLQGIIAFHDHKYFPGVRAVIGKALISGDWIILGVNNNLIWLKKVSSKVA